MSEESLSKQKVHHITEQDLPLSCPMPGMSEWDMHPRVFLSFEEKSEAVCPYCSKQYILVNDA